LPWSKEFFKVNQATIRLRAFDGKADFLDAYELGLSVGKDTKNFNDEGLLRSATKFCLSIGAEEEVAPRVDVEALTLVGRSLKREVSSGRNVVVNNVGNETLA
jgi:hypothetical protein